MPIINIQNRTDKNLLGELAKFLYEEVLLFCESDSFSSLKNVTSNKNYQDFKKSHNLTLVYNSDAESGKFTLSRTKDYNGKQTLLLKTKFAKEDISDKIIFCSIKNRVFTSLFKHIRNAFAHNQIRIDGDHIIMYDSIKPKGGKTMIAHVSIKDIKDLIICLKSIEKK